MWQTQSRNFGETTVALILLAETDLHIRRFIAGILADCGHAVVACADAAEAATSLSQRAVDVVVTDLILDDGEAARLSRDCAARGIPTVTLSGSRVPPGQSAAAAPRGLIEKPFRFDDLRNVLDAVRAPSAATASC
jgi:CheY-like chemotaxis protein